MFSVPLSSISSGISYSIRNSSSFSLQKSFFLVLRNNYGSTSTSFTTTTISTGLFDVSARIIVPKRTNNITTIPKRGVSSLSLVPSRSLRSKRSNFGSIIQTSSSSFTHFLSSRTTLTAPMSSTTTTTTNLSPSSGKYIASIDQGTTSTRVIIFNKEGRPVTTAQKEHKQIFPKSAWVEHDPEEIWNRTKECIQEAMLTIKANPQDMAALGITNQRETMVVWNKQTGKCYYNAIVWQDQRGASYCDHLANTLEGGKQALASRTGAPIIPYFSGSKLHWILENIEGVRKDAEEGNALFGTIDCFLLWRLTNGKVHATDVSNASRTLLYNIHTLQWDPVLLDHFKVPLAMLPAVKPSSHIYGVCNKDIVPDLDNVPIAGILGDQQSALFGQACFEPGDAKNTYGTGCFLLMNTGVAAVPSRHGLLTTIGYQIGNEPVVYALEGSVAVAGAVITWLRDNLKLISSSSESEKIARSVPDSGDTVFVPAFNGLFAPHWRSDARGVLVGVSGNTTAAHIVRAALEAVAFQSKELLDAMDADRSNAMKAVAAEEKQGHHSGLHHDPNSTGTSGGRSPGALAVDGGMTANDLLMQFQADITGKTVVKPVVSETTALGAAYAAGLAVGYWKSLEELRLQWSIEKTWQPSMPKEQVKKLLHKWNKAVLRSLGWAEDEDQESRKNK